MLQKRGMRGAGAGSYKILRLFTSAREAMNACSREWIKNCHGLLCLRGIMLQHTLTRSTKNEFYGTAYTIEKNEINTISKPWITGEA